MPAQNLGVATCTKRQEEVLPPLAILLPTLALIELLLFERQFD